MEEVKCNQVGMLSGDKWDKLHDTNRRVYASDGLSPTLTTMGGGQREVKILEPLAYDEQNGYLRQDGCVGTLTTDGSSPKHNNRIIEPRIAAMRGRNPEKPSDRTAESPTEQRLEIDSDETSNTLTTVQKDNLVVEPNFEQDEFDMGIIYELSKSYRIRKLTERECFGLMGVKEQDFENVKKNQSMSSLYHLAGDSIVTTCLMAIFGELFGVDYEKKISELTNKLATGDAFQVRNDDWEKEINSLTEEFEK